MSTQFKKIDEWLREAGYEHHCFISWPHLDDEIRECAIILQKKIYRELKYYLPKPKVFLDLHIETGDRWRESLRQALCKSIVLVAVWVPVYFDRLWCKWEWDGMDSLVKKRSSNQIESIIPVVYRKEELLPEPVESINLWC